MRKYALAALGITAAAVAAVLVGPTLAGKGTASSHREAPLIAEDPSADNTDLYAFRSPDKANTLTIVSNWIPGEDPAAGPNWYTFSPSARYSIKVDRTGDGRADITYAFPLQDAHGQQGRRQGLLRRLQRPRDRAPDPDLAGRHEEPHDRHLVLHRPPQRHRGGQAQPRLDAGVPP